MVYQPNARFQENVVIGRSLFFRHGEWTVDGSAKFSHYKVNFSLVQYWAPPHWSCRIVGDYLVHNLLQHWISRTADDCWTLLNCPPRSTDVILWDYFVWGFIREEMFFSTQAPESGRLQERNCCRNEKCWRRNRNKRLDGTRLLDWRLQGTRGSFI